MDAKFDFLLLPRNELLDRRLSGERSGSWRPAPATRDGRGEGSQQDAIWRPSCVLSPRGSAQRVAFYRVVAQR